MPDHPILILAGALIGGLVNGLTGFGTGIAALPLWLQALAPVGAAQLVAACSVVGQLTTIRTIAHAVDLKRTLPMILAGLAGVPIGSWIVPMIDVEVFKSGVGVLVISYCVVMAFGHGRLRFEGEPGPKVELAIGFGGGVLSGLAGLSGVLATMWAVLHAWPKERSRALFQAYNLPVLGFTFLVHAIHHGVERQVLIAFVVALPATFAGVAAGQALYHRTSDARFRNLVLVLLLFSGLNLIVSRL